MYFNIKFLIICMVLSMGLTMLIIAISKKCLIDMHKSSPFECGFNPMSYKRLPFSIHFFLIAILFLIFDIEIVIILPLIMTMYNSIMLTWIITSLIFIMILIMGLYHEWYNGMLKWTS
uniref:NADH-ubiquinone oxidoreductase chain 3 n=1 Tax=Cofana yasumatsui TaxID=2741154 RepID=A0A6M8PGW3_9HEMI|nr:NADH dehydrogenase subunit 3 [Cofana yasumatsui]QKG63361.1 NADH dehydrogenase subunit 3 [Cofana yasumatsui]